MNAHTAMTAPVNEAPIIRIAGKTGATRMAAYDRIAPLAFIETKGRADTVANLIAALGKAPTEAQVKTARAEWVIGRVAAKLAPMLAASGDTGLDAFAALDKARDVVLHYAMPSTAKVPGKLKAGQKGRRSDVEHKLVRAADEAWSQLLAETGHGTAKTQATKDAAKKSRKPGGKVSLAKGAAPSHSELVKGDGAKPESAADVCRHLLTQASTLAAYANKYAGLTPTAHGAAVLAFRSALIEADKALDLANAEADAKRADKGK